MDEKILVRCTEQNFYGPTHLTERELHSKIFDDIGVLRDACEYRDYDFMRYTISAILKNIDVIVARHGEIVSLFCNNCGKTVGNCRYRPSPEDGPFWKCGSCGWVIER